MKIEKRGIILQFDENTLTYSMERDHQTWKWPKNYRIKSGKADIW